MTADSVQSPSHSDEEEKRRVSNILTAGIVFPVILLAMSNVTDLNTVVAGWSEISTTQWNNLTKAEKHSIFMVELINLKRRVSLI